MEEAKPPPQKPMGRGEAWALSGDVLLRSLRLWADMATITEWALQGRTFPSFCGLSGFCIGRIMEIAMADATYPKEVIGAAFGFGLASHARKSANTGRRTEAYAMLRLVTTACAAPTALGRFYQLGGRGELNWLDICGCTLDVVDASIAAGAATLGAGAIWKRIRSKAARTGQLVGLSVGYAAENILRLAAYAAVLRGAVPIYVLLFSTGDFLFVLLASCGCARHDRRAGARGAAPSCGRSCGSTRTCRWTLIVIGAWAGRTRCWSSATGGCLGGPACFIEKRRRWRGGVLQGRLIYTWCCSC